MARWLRRMFVTGVAVSSIVGWAMLLDRAATAQTDPQVAEFLTSLNRSVTELPGQTGSQASLTCGRIVASAINMGAVAESALGPVWDRMTSQQRAAPRLRPAKPGHRWKSPRISWRTAGRGG
jgi:hypothetical protein